ncbi:MAG: hypothetical protein ACR2QF_02750 [Geminicoccaceae bacterium]
MTVHVINTAQAIFIHLNVVGFDAERARSYVKLLYGSICARKRAGLIG